MASSASSDRSPFLKVMCAKISCPFILSNRYVSPLLLESDEEDSMVRTIFPEETLEKIVLSEIGVNVDGASCFEGGTVSVESVLEDDVQIPGEFPCIVVDRLIAPGETLKLL